MPKAGSGSAIERDLVEAMVRADQSLIHQSYWEQNEFVLVEQFIPSTVVERCVREAEFLTRDVHRNDMPGYKQGGVVGFYTIRQEAPDILALYQSMTLRSFFGRLVDASLKLCSEDDPHSCALYYYTKPGDYIGFHYDMSYYEGARYTVLVGLVEQSEHCRLVARVRKGPALNEISETRFSMRPGAIVAFNGDKLWHAVTPLGAHERRIVLTLQYVTDQRMRPLKKLCFNKEDAFARFGPAALMHRSIMKDRD